MTCKSCQSVSQCVQTQEKRAADSGMARHTKKGHQISSGEENISAFTVISGLPSVLLSVVHTHNSDFYFVLLNVLYSFTE